MSPTGIDSVLNGLTAAPSDGQRDCAFLAIGEAIGETVGALRATHSVSVTVADFLRSHSMFLRARQEMSNSSAAVARAKNSKARNARASKLKEAKAMAGAARANLSEFRLITNAKDLQEFKAIVKKPATILSY